ncbi:DMT family transporter [Nocardia sp. NPDC050630]|uniref:DMT family transporter n=1 Tax=Nocardia sp. NPDC050630 TaxID=3364321 RepID=UPI0037B5BA9D
MVRANGSVERQAIAAAAVTVVLWASAFVFIRSAGHDFSPGALALGRLLAASITLVTVLFIRGEGLPPRAAWPGIVTSGVLWFGVYMVALNWGERNVDAGTAAMVVGIGPVLIAVLGGVILREGFPVRLMIGLVVSFAGTIVVGVSTSDGGGAAVLGVVLCLLAAVVWAASTIAQKPALATASALQVVTFGSVIGTVACLPFSWQLVIEAADAPLSSTLSLVYLGVFPTALAFTTWAYALARTTAGKMGVTTYAVPALVVLMSWLALDEVPGAPTILGGVLCLTGVAVTRSRSRVTASVDPEAAEPAPR